MKIEVLGMNCAKCEKLYGNVLEAVKQTGIEAEVVKVSGAREIAAYKIMFTPGLVIDGQVKVAGKVPDVKQIIAWLQEGEA